MRIRTICILIKILQDYYELLRATKVGVNSEWRNYFTKQELLSIVTDRKHEKDTLLGDIPTYDIFISLVETEDQIIAYILKRLESAVQNRGAYFDRPLLREVLSQLEMETHYLLDKEMADYDSYDVSNIKGLLRKAGWIHPVWAFANSNELVNGTQEISKMPLIFYDSKTETQEILTSLVKEGHIRPKQIEILAGEIIVNPKTI